MDSIAIRSSSPAFLTIRTHRKSLSLSSPSLTTNHRFTYRSNNSRNSQKSLKVESRSIDDVAFDEAAYEAERLRLDGEARRSMAEREVAEEEGGWKWGIRKRVWDSMEAQNIAQFPRPVHHRIPNFVGASTAANKLSGLEVFREAKCVKVNPDSPQKQVRFLTLNVARAT